MFKLYYSWKLNTEVRGKEQRYHTETGAHNGARGYLEVRWTSSITWRIHATEPILRTIQLPISLSYILISNDLLYIFIWQLITDCILDLSLATTDVTRTLHLRVSFVRSPWHVPNRSVNWIGNGGFVWKKRYYSFSRDANPCMSKY